MELYGYKEMMHGVHRTLGSERERLTERVEQMDELMKMAEATDELISKIEDLEDENERLNEENDMLRQEVQEMMIMELANAIGLTFPEDMIGTLEALDDEPSEEKAAVHVDIVENKFHAPVGQVVERVEKLEHKP